MSARRVILASVGAVALFATGVAAWLEVGVEDRWSGGEPGVVLARPVASGPSPSGTPSPSPSASPSVSPAPSGEASPPGAVYPVPHLPSGASGDGGGSVSSPSPGPARPSAPARPGGGEGDPGRGKG